MGGSLFGGFRRPARDPGAPDAVERGMKKRSMLALASLATGFVVAAVSPSHAAPADLPLHLDVDDTVSTVQDTVATDSLALDGDTLGPLG